MYGCPLHGNMFPLTPLESPSKQKTTQIDDKQPTGLTILPIPRKKLLCNREFLLHFNQFCTFIFNCKLFTCLWPRLNIIKVELFRYCDVTVRDGNRSGYNKLYTHNDTAVSLMEREGLPNQSASNLYLIVHVMQRACPLKSYVLPN
jgi:hypothetical protein